MGFFGFSRRTHGRTTVKEDINGKQVQQLSCVFDNLILDKIEYKEDGSSGHIAKGQFGQLCLGSLINLPKCMLWNVFSMLDFKDLVLLEATNKGITIPQSIWKIVYQNRFRAFYPEMLDAVKDSHSIYFSKWKKAAKDTCIGVLNFRIQVFHPLNDHKTYTMSCYDAIAYYSGHGMVHIQYPIYFKRPSESRPLSDLRAIPEEIKGDNGEYSPWDIFWPPKVSMDDLKVDDVIEVQWKNTRSAQFGWWRGKIASKSRSMGTGYPLLRVIFPHFSPNSPFYSLMLPFGCPRETDDSFVSYNAIGGMRLVSPEEDKEWQRYMPQHKLLK